MSLNESLDSGISFRLALNAGNNNMIQLKGLQSAYYPQTAFYPPGLPSICSLQAMFYTDGKWLAGSSNL